KWKESAPRVVDRDGHAMWVTDDLELSPWGAEPASWKLTLGQRGRRMKSMGFDPEQSRPSDPELRVEDQVKDGVDAEAIYGPLRTWSYLAGLPDEAATVFARAYNEFLAEFCATHPDRFFGLGNLPMVESVDLTCESLRHVAGLGLVGVEIPLDTSDTPLSDESWNPLWETATELGLPLHIHIRRRPGAFLPGSSPLHNIIEVCTHTVVGFAPVLATLVFSGILERHADLRVVMAESGCGWIPYVADRMDFELENDLRPE